MLYIEYLVEQTRDVESQGVGLGHKVGVINILGAYPRAVRERVFELVAIVENIVGAAYWRNISRVNLAQSLEVIYHLLVLVLELFGVVHVLPTASAAGSEVWATDLAAQWRQLFDSHSTAFGVVLLFFVHLYIHHVARHHEGYKHHHIVHTGNGVAFATCVGDFNIGKYYLLLGFAHFHCIVV